MSSKYIDKLKAEFGSKKHRNMPSASSCEGGCCNAPVNMARLNADAVARSNIPIRDIKPTPPVQKSYQDTLPTPYADVPIGDAVARPSQFDAKLAQLFRQSGRDREVAQDDLRQIIREDPSNLLEFFQENARKDGMKQRMAQIYGQNLTDEELADELSKLHRGEKGGYVGRVMRRAATELGVSLPETVEKRISAVEARTAMKPTATETDEFMDDLGAVSVRRAVPMTSTLLGAGGEVPRRIADEDDFSATSAPLMTGTASGNPFRGRIGVEPDADLARAIGAQARAISAFGARAGGAAGGEEEFKEMEDDDTRTMMSEPSPIRRTREVSARATPEVRNLTKQERLKNELRSLGLSTAGKVADLEARLAGAKRGEPQKPMGKRGRPKKGGK
jgi:hypothetical protein